MYQAFFVAKSECQNDAVTIALAHLEKPKRPASPGLPSLPPPPPLSGWNLESPPPSVLFGRSLHRERGPSNGKKRKEWPAEEEFFFHLLSEVYPWGTPPNTYLPPMTSMMATTKKRGLSATTVPNPLQHTAATGRRRRRN